MTDHDKHDANMSKPLTQHGRARGSRVLEAQSWHLEVADIRMGIDDAPLDGGCQQASQPFGRERRMTMTNPPMLACAWSSKRLYVKYVIQFVADSSWSEGGGILTDADLQVPAVMRAAGQAHAAVLQRSARQLHDLMQHLEGGFPSAPSLPASFASRLFQQPLQAVHRCSKLNLPCKRIALYCINWQCLSEFPTARHVWVQCTFWQPFCRTWRKQKGTRGI